MTAFNFLEIVKAAADKAQSGGIDYYTAPAKHQIGVVTNVSVRPTQAQDKHILRYTVTCTVGPNKGLAASGSTCYSPTNEKTVSFLVALIAASGKSPEEVLGGISDPEDTLAVSATVAASLLGARIKYNVDDVPGQTPPYNLQVAWPTAAPETAPPNEVEPTVKDLSEEIANAAAGRPAAPVSRGRVAL